MNHSNEEFLKELEQCHNIMHLSPIDKHTDKTIKCNCNQVLFVVRLVNNFQERVTAKECSHAQQFMLSKGLKVFGNRGKEASMKESDQLHQRNCFTLASINDVTMEGQQKAQVASRFLTEKRDESVKARMICNGKPAREWLSREILQVPQLLQKAQCSLVSLMHINREM